jgi:hypothetical protein
MFVIFQATLSRTEELAKEGVVVGENLWAWTIMEGWVGTVPNCVRTSL